MCGILFARNLPSLTYDRFSAALSKQAWRGPDHNSVKVLNPSTFIGHVRLSILDITERSDQPLVSSCGRYIIAFNGEIYNHLEIRTQLDLRCRTSSDTETIITGFAKIGINIFEMLDGMFAIVIYDTITHDVWAARDRFGIKPLYKSNSLGSLIYSSECISINDLYPNPVDFDSIDEWRMLRRPMPGMSFFKGISEVLPGCILQNGVVKSYMNAFSGQHKEQFDQQTLQSALSTSVSCHELSDVEIVSLLSGGIDSALISALSSCQNLYSVGFEDNNEFAGAKSTACQINRYLNIVNVDEHDIIEAWKHLVALKGEPLYVPNEALIYLVCKSMKPCQKVVLTGEGADELFFGYDNIFRWTINQATITVPAFLNKYSYQRDYKLTTRLEEYLDDLLYSKSPVEFVEDFFLKVHLPGLLRRMDFASMAASKESRVPFVCKNLVDYMYRRSSMIKLDDAQSKKPLRAFIKQLGLSSVLERRKVGFSTTFRGVTGKHEEYAIFQELNLSELGW